MYGRWVTVHLGDGTRYKVEVWVNCSPDTPATELEKQARGMLMDKLIEENKPWTAA